jgi:hypothetical protein
MSTQDPAPKEFNAEYKRAVEEYMGSIPNPSGVPESGDCTFSKPIVWAKDQLRTHYNMAAGIDRVHYREIMAIENKVLCRLINECMDRNEALLVWFTTIIAVIPKKDKPLSEADSYWTVGLESCFLKLVCLLIHKHIYSWPKEQDIIPPSQCGRVGGPVCRNRCLLHLYIYFTFTPIYITSSICIVNSARSPSFRLLLQHQQPV